MRIELFDNGVIEICMSCVVLAFVSQGAITVSAHIVGIQGNCRAEVRAVIHDRSVPIGFF